MEVPSSTIPGARPGWRHYSTLQRFKRGGSVAKFTAIRYASDGIRANSVHVCTTVTSMTAGMLVDEAGREFNLLSHLFDRLGVGQDVAYGVLP